MSPLLFNLLSLLIGLIFGLVIAWILESWVDFFLKKITLDNFNRVTKKNTSNNSTFLVRIQIYAVISIIIAFFFLWRKWHPELLSDIILFSALFGVAWIDKKTLLIEGRIITLAMILRLLWLSYFEDYKIYTAVVALILGAGILYLVSFFYETFRHRQGLGEGDAAVLGLIGMWVGWQKLGLVLLIAGISGILIGGLTLIRQRSANQKIVDILQKKIPFAPFLCAGGLIVYILQETGFLGSINEF
tara:strand:+ start:1770 stop:2504 length:735 start_codon:yes stop_codon:yes gene_type:complete